MTLRQPSNTLQKVCDGIPPPRRHRQEPNALGPPAATQQLPNIQRRSPGRTISISPSARVSVFIDGKAAVLGTGPPQFSSATTQWSGFLLERHNLVGVFADVSWHSSHVIMCLGGSSVIRVSGGAGNVRCAVQPGRIFIFPGGCGKTNISVAGTDCRFIVTELDGARLRQLLVGAEFPGGASLAPQLNIDDPHIVRMIENMVAEVTAGCQCGPLYGESLSLSLAAYVAAHYPVKALMSQDAEQGFTSAQTQTVIDYVHANLRSDLTLLELAGAMDLSPRHFSRLFRTTFGMPPHRYVITERVNEAKALLASKRLAIVEIAETLGFADQSHLTNVFRKLTGISPKRYQRER